MNGRTHSGALGPTAWGTHQACQSSALKVALFLSTHLPTQDTKPCLARLTDAHVNTINCPWNQLSLWAPVSHLNMKPFVFLVVWACLGSLVGGLSFLGYRQKGSGVGFFCISFCKSRVNLAPPKKRGLLCGSSSPRRFLYHRIRWPSSREETASSNAA